MTPPQGLLFQPPHRDSNLRVGPAGWSYKDWEGIVYPAGSAANALSFLIDYCDTIEINSSFYAPPRPRDAAAWARRARANPRFRFTAKVWRRITHERTAGDESSLQADCNAVCASFAPLAEAGILGAVLIQFPWSFRCIPKNQEYLEKIFRRLREFPLVVEVRHSSWDHDPFYAFLEQRDAAFCNVDQPVIGNSIGPGARATSRIGYFRLHGRNYANWFKEDAGRDERYDYLYNREEIRQLSENIRTVRKNTDETYVITNNHFRGQALVNALEIAEEIDGVRPNPPPLLAAAYPGRLGGL
ncbi:MAG TPA: DUF72 domain-containing protein [Acidobacteriota bacterium]|nr:DUF72 domain-containing protein [Acidobacteriota bacterium]